MGGGGASGLQINQPKRCSLADLPPQPMGDGKGVSENNIPPIRIFGIDDNGVERVPLRHNIAWRLRLPDPNAGQRMVLVVALDQV